MLSKPCAESSGGSRSAPFTSTDSRSRTAFEYSFRFNRCSTWLLLTCAWFGSLSSESSRNATSESTALPSGCFAPGGGITRPRSLRTAFSKSSGLCDALRRDALKAHAADLGFVVVATRAVLLHRRQVGVGRILRLDGGGQPARQR